MIVGFGQCFLSTAEVLAFQTADIAAHVSQTTDGSQESNELADQSEESDEQSEE
jgi:hypothetical protein